MTAAPELADVAAFHPGPPDAVVVVRPPDASPNRASPFGGAQMQTWAWRVSCYAIRVAFDGELDVAVAQQMRHLGDGLVDTGASVVEMDLAGVSFIDVAGLRTLAALKQRLESQGVEVVDGPCSTAVDRLATLLADLASTDDRTLPLTAANASTAGGRRQAIRGRSPALVLADSDPRGELRCQSVR